MDQQVLHLKDVKKKIVAETEVIWCETPHHIANTNTVSYALSIVFGEQMLKTEI